MKRVLYIEDMALEEEIIRKISQEIWQRFHGKVQFDGARSFEAGEKMMESESYDVVILDLKIPPMGTRETLNQLMLRKSLGDKTPFVVLTGDEFTENIRENSFLAGADDFMLKKDVFRHPEAFCERVYHAYLRRRRNET